MQISRMLLVYDVKLSQLGRKNLAVRFNLITRCRGASGVSRKTESRERVFPRLLPERLARNVEASSSISWQSGPSPG
jgi:hypothetical protein